MSFAVEWFDPAPVQSSPSPAVSEMAIRLREPQSEIEARIGMAALIAYADAIEQRVQQHFASSRPTKGADLELDCVLSAGHSPRLELSSYPPLAGLETLWAHLAAVVAPPLREGEVAFRGRFALWGGASA
jgi:hypothetical protein